MIKVWKDSDSSDSSEVPEVSKPFLSHYMQGRFSAVFAGQLFDQP